MDVPPLSALSPAVSPASYWMPVQNVASAWIEHAPFAFWLMDALRPDTVAELGTHNGFSFFVFAEAAKRLGLKTRISALDSWEGDDQAGFYGESVHRSVEKISKSEYPGITELVRGYFNDSVEHFADGSIRLLHIDGRHGYDDVKEDYENYLPKLAPDGVVIFHDIFEFQEGFGVHRFWDEISATAPSFGFRHGHGLGVLAPGAQPPDAILRFFDVASRGGEDLRAFYSGQGAMVAHRFDSAEQALEIENLRTELKKYGRALEEAQSTIAAMSGSASWRVTRPLRGARRLAARGSAGSTATS